VRRLLAEADRLYASGDRGLRFLPWRAAVAGGAARRIYAAIGTVIARRGNQLRAVVPAVHKLLLVARAVLAARPRRSAPPALLPASTRYPDDVLPL
jgi:phytoene synthase